MMDETNLVIILLFCVVKAENPRRFPSSITFGTGSSAYQIEGAWNKDGKSENIWDHWTHEGFGHVADNDTADVACNSYYNTLDSYYLSKMGVKHYRFSLSWSRILPNGSANEVNANAVLYYSTLIELLRIYHITPIVTLYYHDLPQALQDIGGWTNPSMVKYFVDYARVCFQYFFGVQYWITFNDPWATCRRGYGDGTFAPGIASDGIGDYLCAYNVVRAHAAVYHLYKEEFKHLKGKISIAIDMKWSEPVSENDADAVERRNAFEFGLYANPIYKGNWPSEVIERVEFRSKNENFTRSRLPEFTEEEIDYINGTSDFMAVNMYYTNEVEDTKEADFNDISYTNDVKVKIDVNSNWEVAVNGQPIVPLSARKTLVWLSKTYNNPEIFITENGIPDIDPSSDLTRIHYFWRYLNAILDAILEDGVKVIGYTAARLFDSFEWTDGYRYKFGFYHVDFNSTNRYRVAKDSVQFYKQLIETLTIPDDPFSTTTTSIPQTTPDCAIKIVLSPIFLICSMLVFLY